jgi:hypothetical protein
MDISVGLLAMKKAMLVPFALSEKELKPCTLKHRNVVFFGRRVGNDHVDVNYGFCWETRDTGASNMLNVEVVLRQSGIDAGFDQRECGRPCGIRLDNLDTLFRACGHNLSVGGVIGDVMDNGARCYHSDEQAGPGALVR